MTLADFLPSADQFPIQGQGVVKSAVTSRDPGRVYFKATYWPARLAQTETVDSLLPGDLVEVLGRDRLTLLVKPVSRRIESE